MKRHQIITLIFLLWITVTAIQLEQKVQQHAEAVVEQYWEIDSEEDLPCEQGESPETFILAVKCVGGQLLPLLDSTF